MSSVWSNARKLQDKNLGLALIQVWLIMLVIILFAKDVDAHAQII